MSESKAETKKAKDTVREAELLVQATAARAAIFLARALARVREEAEDMWAEAKSIGAPRR